MTCGMCPFTDGMCYTSNPPRRKCKITGEYHYYTDECNCDVAEISVPAYCTSCLICGKEITLCEGESAYEVCNECKKAIQFVKDNLMEKKDG